MRVKVAASWMDFGPRIMQSMDHPLTQAPFRGSHALDAGRHETDGPSDRLATLYAGTTDITGRLVSVREEE